MGLAITVLGAVVDVGYHLGTNAPGTAHSPIAFTGHLVTLVGMVVTMLGLIGAALKRRTAEAKPTQKGHDR